MHKTDGFRINIKPAELGLISEEKDSSLCGVVKRETRLGS